MPTRLEDLINKQRQAVAELITDDLHVVLGGELVKIEATKLLPHLWEQLVDTHPPRAGVDGDTQVGYNERSLASDYPATSLLVDGEQIDQRQWKDIYGSLEVVHRSNVATLMWGVNVHGALEELKELGKALAGEPAS